MIRPEIEMKPDTFPDAFPDALSLHSRKPLIISGLRFIRSVRNHFRMRSQKKQRIRKCKTHPVYFPDVLSLSASMLYADTSGYVRKCSVGKRIYPEIPPYFNRGYSGCIPMACGRMGENRI
jgi:hypothetical protein